MKCTNCGYEIPSGMLYCKRCGEEVCIVPDYNPLDDMLTTQIRVSLDEESEYINHSNHYNSTRNVQHHTNARRTSNSNRSSSNRNSARPRTMDEREARRRQAERRREIKRKKRQKLLIIMAVMLAALIGLGILLYQTSYTGIVKKGNKALISAEYAIAQERFEKAISKKPAQPDAYVGLSQVFITKGNMTGAEQIFLDAISAQPDNASIYEACIEFYLTNDQALKIPTLLAKAEDKVRDALNDYII